MTGPAPIDKDRVLDALRARLADKRAALAAFQQSTQAGATHAEARPEHAKDTRAIEAGYLARGLAERVEELDRAAALLEALRPREFGDDDHIATGALVGLEDGNGGEWVAFLAPAGGGEKLEIDGSPVRAVTPRSPLGGALLGLGVGDEVAHRRPGGAGKSTVAWIR